ncbi:MAG: RNA polymerase sigma factor [Gemmataceae bacterium]
MSSVCLEGLLERLTAGDPEAAEQVFLAYEPYLRMVVRRRLPARLRSKFDSIDVVQSVWADVVHGFREAGWHFTNASQLKAFLVKVTQNRFLDRVRKHGTSANREQSLSCANGRHVAPEEASRPSQVVQADELWQRMLRLCPPAHHELLRLKRQGCSLAEIAQRTNLHASSVRRILYELARRFAEEG